MVNVTVAVVCMAIGSQALDAQLLTAVQQGYSNHRAAFSVIDCKYEIRHGKAKSIAEAVEKGPMSSVQRFSARWTKDGVRECLVISPEASLPLNATASPVPIVRVLKDGNYELSYSDLFGGGNIVPLDVSESLISFTPLDMGAMGEGSKGSPSSIIAGAAPGQIVSAEQTPPHFVTFVRRLTQGDDSQDTRFEINLSQGFALESITTTINGELVSKVVVTEKRACSKNRWFPIRSVAVIPDPGGDVLVREFCVLQFQLDSIPPEKAFSISLPKGAHFNDPRSVGSQIVMDEEFHVNLKDLSLLYSKSREAIEIKKREQDELVRSRSVLLFATPVTAILVVTLAVWSFWRLRRSGRR
jgi:hypothetical protein